MANSDDWQHVTDIFSVVKTLVDTRFRAAWREAMSLHCRLLIIGPLPSPGIGQKGQLPHFIPLVKTESTGSQRVPITLHHNRLLNSLLHKKKQKLKTYIF